MDVLQSDSESETYSRKKSIYIYLYVRSLSYGYQTFNSLGICVNTVLPGELDRKSCSDAMFSVQFNLFN